MPKAHICVHLLQYICVRWQQMCEASYSLFLWQHTGEATKKTPLFIPFGFPKKVTVFFPLPLNPHNNNNTPPTTTTTTLHPLLPAASYHAALFPWQQELIWRSCRGRWRSRVFVCTHVCGSAHTHTDSPYTHGVTKEENDYPYLSLCSLRDGFYSLCVHPSLCRSVCLSVLDQSQVPCLKRL